MSTSYKLCAREEGIYFDTDGSREEEAALIWLVLTVGEGWEGLRRQDGAVPLPVMPFLSDQERDDFWRGVTSVSWWDYGEAWLATISRVAFRARIGEPCAGPMDRYVRALKVQDRYHSAGQKLDALRALTDFDLKRNTLRAMSTSGQFREAQP